MLTLTQKMLVQESFAMLVPIADDAAALFYRPRSERVVSYDCGASCHRTGLHKGVRRGVEGHETRRETCVRAHEPVGLLRRRPRQDSSRSIRRGELWEGIARAPHPVVELAREARPVRSRSRLAGQIPKLAAIRRQIGTVHRRNRGIARTSSASSAPCGSGHARPACRRTPRTPSRAPAPRVHRGPGEGTRHRCLRGAERPRGRTALEADR